MTTIASKAKVFCNHCGSFLCTNEDLFFLNKSPCELIMILDHQSSVDTKSSDINLKCTNCKSTLGSYSGSHGNIDCKYIQGTYKQQNIKGDISVWMDMIPIIKSKDPEDQGRLQCNTCQCQILSSVYLSFFFQSLHSVRLIISPEELETAISLKSFTTKTNENNTQSIYCINDHLVGICSNLDEDLDILYFEFEKSNTSLYMFGKRQSGRWSELEKILPLNKLYISSMRGSHALEDITPPNIPNHDDLCQMLQHYELTKTKPHDYQIEMFYYAMQFNAIIHLITGAGKTLVSAMAIQVFHTFNKHKFAIVVEPTVTLVIQQSEYYRKELNLRVQECVGDIANTKKSEIWKLGITLFDILVITPQMLYDFFGQNRIQMSQISCIIIDEAHAVRGDHPIKRLLKSHYLVLNAGYRPRLIGLTASPDQSNDPLTRSTIMSELEATFSGRLVTPIHTNMFKLIDVANTKLQVINNPDPDIQMSHLLSNFFELAANYISQLLNIPPTTTYSPTILWHSHFSHLINTNSNSSHLPFIQLFKEISQSFDILYVKGPYHTAIALLSHLSISSIDIPLGFQSTLSNFKSNLSQISNSNNPTAYSARTNTLIALLSTIISNATPTTFPNIRILVFVNKRVYARLLYILTTSNPLLKSLNPSYIIGQQRTNSNTNMQLTLDHIPLISQFKNGLSKLLISTSVLEQGFDIPNCNHVFLFNNEYLNPTKFIQIRGRARGAITGHAIFTILCNHNDAYKLQISRASEAKQRHAILDHCTIWRTLQFDAKIKMFISKVTNSRILIKPQPRIPTYTNTISINLHLNTLQYEQCHLLATNHNIHATILNNTLYFNANIPLSLFIPLIATLIHTITPYTPFQLTNVHQFQFPKFTPITYNTIQHGYYKSNTFHILSTHTIPNAQLSFNTHTCTFQLTTTTQITANISQLILFNPITNTIILHLNNIINVSNNYSFHLSPLYFLFHLQTPPFSLLQLKYISCDLCQFDTRIATIQQLPPCTLLQYAWLTHYAKYYYYLLVPITNDNYMAYMSHVGVPFADVSISVPDIGHINMPVPDIGVSTILIHHVHVYHSHFTITPFIPQQRNRLLQDQPYYCTDYILVQFHKSQIHDILTNGFILNTIKYNFIGATPSQVKSQSAWFSTFNNISQFGDFNVITNHGLRLSRIGLLFSSTYPIINVPIDVIYSIQSDYNTPNYKYCYSDGCGTINTQFAQYIKHTLKIHQLSCVQFRCGGYKGVLSVDNKQSCPMICRGSMLKFTSLNRSFEVCRVNTRMLCTLNKQIIMVLRTLGINECVFHDLLHCTMDKLETCIKVPEPFTEMPQLRSYMQYMKYNTLKLKLNLEVPHGRLLMGIVDEYNVLKENEICVIISDYVDTNNKHNSKYHVISKCVFIKNPVIHPGDCRVVDSVYYDVFDHLVDCVVVNRRGLRDLSSMSSGGDLDGDLYTVIWDKRLIPSKCVGAMVASATSASGNEDLLDLADAVCDTNTSAANDTNDTSTSLVTAYMSITSNKTLGILSNAQLAIADSNPMQLQHPNCILLSHLIASSVDYNKHMQPIKMPLFIENMKYPDYMGGEDNYTSVHILGQLYRAIRVPVMPNLNVASNVASNLNVPHLSSLDTIYRGYAAKLYYLQLATKTTNEYELILINSPLLVVLVDETRVLLLGCITRLLEVCTNRNERLNEIIRYLGLFELQSFQWCVLGDLNVRAGVGVRRTGDASDASKHAHMIQAYKSRVQIGMKINKIVNSIYHTYRVHIYGSTSYLLFNSKSDIDMYLEVDDTNGVDDVLKVVYPYIRDYYGNVSYIENTRIPIIKFELEGYACSITYNKKAPYKSILLLGYYDAYPGLYSVLYRLTRMYVTRMDGMNKFGLIWYFIEYCCLKGIIKRLNVGFSRAIIKEYEGMVEGRMEMVLDKEDGRYGEILGEFIDYCARGRLQMVDPINGGYCVDVDGLVEMRLEEETNETNETNSNKYSNKYHSCLIVQGIKHDLEHVTINKNRVYGSSVESRLENKNKFGNLIREFVSGGYSGKIRYGLLGIYGDIGDRVQLQVLEDMVGRRTRKVVEQVDAPLVVEQVKQIKMIEDGRDSILQQREQMQILEMKKIKIEKIKQGTMFENGVEGHKMKMVIRALKLVYSKGKEEIIVKCRINKKRYTIIINKETLIVKYVVKMVDRVFDGVVVTDKGLVQVPDIRYMIENRVKCHLLEDMGICSVLNVDNELVGIGAVKFIKKNNSGMVLFDNVLGKMLGIDYIRIVKFRGFVRENSRGIYWINDVVWHRMDKGQIVESGDVQEMEIDYKIKGTSGVEIEEYWDEFYDIGMEVVDVMKTMDCME